MRVGKPHSELTQVINFLSLMMTTLKDIQRDSQFQSLVTEVEMMMWSRVTAKNV